MNVKACSSSVKWSSALLGRWVMRPRHASAGTRSVSGSGHTLSTNEWLRPESHGAGHDPLDAISSLPLVSSEFIRESLNRLRRSPQTSLGRLLGVARAGSRPETALFGNFVVRLRIPLCGVLGYASAGILVFLELAQKSLVSASRTAQFPPEFPDGNGLGNLDLPTTVRREPRSAKTPLTAAGDWREVRDSQALDQVFADPAICLGEEREDRGDPTDHSALAVPRSASSGPPLIVWLNSHNRFRSSTRRSVQLPASVRPPIE